MSYSIKLKWFGVQPNASSIWISMVVAWNFCQSVAGCIKMKLRSIRFCESFDKYVDELLTWICEYTIAWSLVAANTRISARLRCHVNICWFQKKIIKNLTVNYIICVDEKLYEISNLLHGASDGQSAYSKPHMPSAKSVTAVPSYVYNYLAGCSWLWLRPPCIQ